MPGERLGSLPLAELVTKQRERLSLSLEETAQQMQGAAGLEDKECAFTRQTIYEIERGRIPHPRNLRWLAAGLDLPIERVTEAARQQRMKRRELLQRTAPDAGVLLLSTAPWEERQLRLETRLGMPTSTTAMEDDAAGDAVARLLAHHNQNERADKLLGPHASAGTVTGAVLTLTRMSAGLSQEAFAELLRVSLDTVQGWESGRRPLPATSAAALLDIRHELAAADADTHLVAALDPAARADWIIDRTLEPHGRAHPLAGWVTTRRVHDLLMWALVGRWPEWLVRPANGRGVVPGGLVVASSERRAVFARLRDLAERADGRQASGLQLRRQAAYLAAYDPTPDTGVWIDHLPRVRPLRGGWSPEWVAARSHAVIAAARGDPGPLRWFIDHALAGDDRLESAQLAYNAHYYEELAAPQHSDTFMVADLPAWRGEQLLAWLAGRLDPTCGYVDLMAHTLWTLLASRHYLAVSVAAEGLVERVESLLDADVVSARSHRELGEVRYLLDALDPTRGSR
jgi:transcriptional regulator with XRE-family HTH domain